MTVRAGLSSAASTRPNSRVASRAASTRNSEFRPPTRQSLSNHDIKVLENRRASLPASRLVSTSHTLIHQSASRIHSAVDGALSVGGKGRYESPASMSHLNIPDLASFKKPTFTGSRSWRELKSWEIENTIYKTTADDANDGRSREMGWGAWDGRGELRYRHVN